MPPAETNRTMGGFQTEITVPPGNPMGGAAGRARGRRRIRLLARFRRLVKEAPNDIRAMIDGARASRTRDLTGLTEAELLHELRRIRQVGLRYQPTLQIAAAYYGGWMSVAQDLLEWSTGDREESLVTRMLAASGDVVSAEHGYGLYELARLVEAEPDARQALADSDPFA